MGNPGFAIGIDLGTSTSELSVFRNEEPHVVPDPLSPTKSAIIPSLVAVNRRGELVVGEEARSYVDLEGQGVREVKRLMGSGRRVRLGDREYHPEEISSLILRYLKETAEQSLGITIRDVVLSVPANFPDAARQATMEAGRLAGLNVVRLINEPTAAALAFGVRNIDVEEQLVVFDFGGGTLDITVLEMVAGVLDVKASFGDTQLGGKDFDEAMIELILAKFGTAQRGIAVTDRHRAALKRPAEAAKIALSKYASHSVRVANFAVAGGIPLDLEVEITREEFERAIVPLLDRARACVKRALDAKQVRPEAVDRVLLVGGTTYIPAVRQLVAGLFGREPKAEVNPDLAVALGASIQAAIINDLIDPETGVILTDVAPMGFGIDIISEVGGQWMVLYDPLIQPNTTIPYSVKRSYQLMSDSQKQAEIRLFQDYSGRAKRPEDAIDTGISATIRDIPPSSTGQPHSVEVEFSYDSNGMIQLYAHIPGTGQGVSLHHHPSPLRLSDEEKDLAFQNVKDLWKSSTQAKQYDHLIGKAERVAETVAPERRADLTAAISEMKMALVSEDKKQIGKAADRLVDLLFELEDIV